MSARLLALGIAFAAAWWVGARRQFAARPAECRRGDGLALAAIGARPDRIVHALQRDEAPAGIAHRRADLDVKFARLRQRAAEDAIGFVQCETHRFPPLVTVDPRCGPTIAKLRPIRAVECSASGMPAAG